MWTVVARSAVIKAGGAFVLMDVSRPNERLRMIARQANSLVLLSSASQMLAAQLAE